VRRERCGGVGREAAAEIGTHQVAPAVGGGARHREHRNAERRDVGDEARLVERRMDRVARAGMGQAEIEQRLGGERGAGRASPIRAGVRARSGDQGSGGTIFVIASEAKQSRSSEPLRHEIASLRSQ